MSGGQKQRVCLARALYADSDIYLLDDPLSAVDAKVGQEIFNRMVVGLLRDKTVLLVSHGLQYLQRCNTLIFLQAGRVVESGSPAELLARPDSHLARLAGYDLAREGSGDSGQQGKRGRTESVTLVDEEEAVQVVAKEEGSSGSSWLVWLRYLHQCGSVPELVVIFLSILLFILARTMTSVWVQIWLDAGDGREPERRDNATFLAGATEAEVKGIINYNAKLWFYQLIYAVIIFAMLFFGVLKVSM